MKKRILFVDDEDKLLEGLQRMLRCKRDEWDMAFAQSGQEALHQMARQRFDVIVSDVRMPGLDGITLLQWVAEFHPDTIRFILSGQCDRETTLQSIGVAHQFMAKPCEAETLVNTISAAFVLRDLLCTEELKRLVTQIRVLPSPPELYLKVVEELRSPYTSIQRVGQLIERDIGMSAKILQLVNSSFFGLKRNVTSPSKAASLLGVDILKSLVLVVDVFSSLDTSHVPGFSIEQLWSHSLLVAQYARSIAQQEKANKTVTENTYLAGVFHDIGLFLLVANMPDAYCRVMQYAADQRVSLVDAEKAVLNATHAEVGAYLLGLWGFRDSIVEACAYHHNPDYCLSGSFGPLTAVHVAESIERTENSSFCCAVDERYIERLGLKGRLVDWRETAHRIRED